MKTQYLAAPLMMFLIAAPLVSWAGDTPGKARFQNNTSKTIIVNILHSNGDQQKKSTIPSTKKNTFKFKSGEKCRNKNRLFEIRAAENNALLAKGSLTYNSDIEYFARSESCVLYMQPPIIEVVDSRFSLDYEKLKKNLGEFSLNLKRPSR
ncbi:MAG: hypothetical protein L3J24_06035 [Xanthomonadales bacterium]|nr:hypothetical protein [Xanthomonadales bacterium]